MDGFEVSEFVKYVGAMIALLDPVTAMALMLALTPGYSRARRIRVAFVTSATVLVTLMIASWLGEGILAFFAISPDIFRATGGLLAVVIAIAMIRPNADHGVEMPSGGNHDPAVVPLGIPLIAGPGPVAIAVLFANHPHPTWNTMSAHIAAIVVATLVVLVFLLAAAFRERGFGKLGMRIAIQAMGLILAAIGIEMIVSGIMDYVGWQSAALPV
jgi:multiple antibiotic resistance protein